MQKSAGGAAEAEAPCVRVHVLGAGHKELPYCMHICATPLPSHTLMTCSTCRTPLVSNILISQNQNVEALAAPHISVT